MNVERADSVSSKAACQAEVIDDALREYIRFRGSNVQGRAQILELCESGMNSRINSVFEYSLCREPLPVERNSSINLFLAFASQKRREAFSQRRADAAMKIRFRRRTATQSVKRMLETRDYACARIG